MLSKYRYTINKKNFRWILKLKEIVLKVIIFENLICITPVTTSLPIRIISLGHLRGKIWEALSVAQAISDRCVL